MGEGRERGWAGESGRHTCAQMLAYRRYEIPTWRQVSCSKQNHIDGGARCQMVRKCLLISSFSSRVKRGVREAKACGRTRDGNQSRPDEEEEEEEEEAVVVVRRRRRGKVRVRGRQRAQRQARGVRCHRVLSHPLPAPPRAHQRHSAPQAPSVVQPVGLKAHQTARRSSHCVAHRPVGFLLLPRAHPATPSSAPIPLQHRQDLSFPEISARSARKTPARCTAQPPALLGLGTAPTIFSTR